MDDNLPDPLISLEFSVRLACNLMLHHFMILWFCICHCAGYTIIVVLLHLSVIFQVHTFVGSFSSLVRNFSDTYCKAGCESGNEAALLYIHTNFKNTGVMINTSAVLQ